MQYLRNRKTQHHQGDRNGNREKTRPIRPYPSTHFPLEKMISSIFVYALSSIAAIFKFVERLYYEVHVAFNDPIVHGLNQRGE